MLKSRANIRLRTVVATLQSVVFSCDMISRSTGRIISFSILVKGIFNTLVKRILSTNMPILYSVVARGTIILAKHAACVGNFEEVTAKILAKIPPDNDKLTYSQGPYLFHYICEDRLIYMCITDDDFQRSRAFLYLNEIKRRFLAVYGPGVQTAVAYAMNTEFGHVLANEMKHYSESKDLDRLSKVHGELDELKDIMVKNIDNIAMRGERLELLVNKTENLSANSVTFRKTSRNLARSLFWKNVKIYVIVGAILIVVIYVIVSITCGGLAWQKCVGN